MAHLTESVPAPAHNTGPLWGFFGEVGNAQWQWEAPTTRKSTGPLLQHYRLALGMEHFPEVVPESAVVAGSMNKPTKETVAIEEDISKFRTTLLAASSDQLPDICEEFNQLYKQSLKLGLVSRNYNAQRSQYHIAGHTPRILRVGLADTYCFSRSINPFGMEC